MAAVPSRSDRDEGTRRQVVATGVLVMVGAAFANGQGTSLTLETEVPASLVAESGNINLDEFYASPIYRCLLRDEPAAARNCCGWQQGRTQFSLLHPVTSLNGVGFGTPGS